MKPELRKLASEAKGFMDDDEGLRLYALAREYGAIGPVLEIGSYCGKSSIYLGAGVQEAGGTLLCLDHHRGSEEHQPGEDYHDSSLFDAEVGAMDTLVELRRNLRRAGLESNTVLLVAPSTRVSALWREPLGMVFIDGGHSFETARSDYAGWWDKVAPGGVLAIHDLFPDPATGGQAPIEIYRQGLSSGHFEALPTTKTLGVLRRL